MRVGIFCPPIPGHLNPLCAVGRELVRRGHQVTLFQIPDLEEKARTEGLGFAALLGKHFGPGDLARRVAKLSSLSGKASIDFAIQCGRQMSQLILDAAPKHVQERNLDLLIVDQNEPAGGTVAEHLGIPFVSTCTSLPLNRETAVPPPMLGWKYRGGGLARLRNRLGYFVWDRFIREITRTLNAARSRWGLSALRIPDDSFSRLGQFAQLPREFDFPRTELPANFHYTGPWFDEQSCRAEFPFQKLDGRPLVYASLGTLQGNNSRLFQMIAEACSGLEVQLVLTTGGGPTSLPGLPGDPIVVDFAPQLDLLRRAALTVTHAGMNTTQQSLFFGVPLVAVPLTHDQPAIAARLARTRAGIVIEPSRMSPETLRTSVLRALAPGSIYRQRAGELRSASQQLRGIQAVADMIEAIPNSASKPRSAAAKSASR